MAVAGLLTLSNSSTELQDLGGDLEHVIINDSIDYVTPSSQPTYEIV
jgi:hypothetical protein